MDKRIFSSSAQKHQLHCQTAASMMSDGYYNGDGAGHDGYDEDEFGGIGAALEQSHYTQDVDFDDPKIAALPRVLLMGPRRGGKSSIQVSSRGDTGVNNSVSFAHSIHMCVQ